MGLKKRNKVNAVFNMSSLTDMIFLLLIFFVLNSSVVAPNSLNLKLPGTSSADFDTDNRSDEVSLSRDGKFYLNGKRRDLLTLDDHFAAKAGKKDATMIISPAKGTPIEFTAQVMNIAMKYEIETVMAIEE